MSVNWLVSLSVVVLYYKIAVLVFFFKQRTAYEMRISDWSSDVCSSDLRGRRGRRPRRRRTRRLELSRLQDQFAGVFRRRWREGHQIGRASLGKECVSTCRSRWSPYH